MALILSASLLLQVNISVSAEETSSPATSTSEETVFANKETANEEEIFDHSTFSDEMLSAAIKRYQPPRLRNVDPYDDDPHLIVPGAALPYIGDPHVAVFYINFPNDTEDPVNQKHPEGDDENALQTALTNLHDYYERASYGKLNITEDVIIYNAEKPRGEYSNKEALSLLTRMLRKSRDDLQWCMKRVMRWDFRIIIVTMQLLLLTLNICTSPAP